jgi:hypothetical protein
VEPPAADGDAPLLLRRWLLLVLLLPSAAAYCCNAWATPARTARASIDRLTAIHSVRPMANRDSASTNTAWLPSSDSSPALHFAVLLLLLLL